MPTVIPETLRLDGMKALTDETGMLQHTKFSTIDRREGYTADDNARALIAALRYHRIYGDPESLQLANTYMTFLLHMQRSDGSFHNLLGFDRGFRDDVGSEDSMGRALWAAGYAMASGAPKDTRRVAKEIFDRGLPSSHRFTSPRAKAYALLGLHRYHEALPDDENIVVNIEVLAGSMSGQYQAVAVEDWRWFETYLTYANPRLPQALFAAYESTKEPAYLRVAQNSLDFLIGTQFIDDVFVPVGTEGWYKRDGEMAVYDQQPIEASCMVEASIAALISMGESRYGETAQTAFEWYHGRNTQGAFLFNPGTCTCYDGITPEGVNRNQGAEATLSYYLAYLRMRENGLV